MRKKIISSIAILLVVTSSFSLSTTAIENASSECFEEALQLYNIYIGAGRTQAEALEAGADWYDLCVEEENPIISIED